MTGRDNSNDHGLDGQITLKCILVCWCECIWIGLVTTDILCSLRVRKFLNNFSNYQLLRVCSLHFSYLATRLIGCRFSGNIISRVHNGVCLTFILLLSQFTLQWRYKIYKFLSLYIFFPFPATKSPKCVHERPECSKCPFNFMGWTCAIHQVVTIGGGER